NILGELVGVGGVIGDQHFGNTTNHGSGFSDATDVLPSDQDGDISTNLQRGRNGIERRGAQRAIGMFCNNQHSHQITFASFFSFSTSSATDFTLMPALRAAGASTLSVFTVEAVEMLNASGERVSSGFFFAFMMFGSDA